MSFWGNMDPTETTGEIKDDYDVLPDGTTIQAMVDECVWDEYEGERKIKLTWTILAPKEYQGRKVFQNIKVFDLNDKKRQRALNMFAAICKNSGRMDILESGSEPDPLDLAGLIRTAPQFLKLGVWEIDGRQGNWVKAVSYAGEAKAGEAKPTTKPTADLDDEIPF